MPMPLRQTSRDGLGGHSLLPQGSTGPFQDSLFARQRRTVTRMVDPPNKTASVTVDELLGMAHDAYARARASPDASTKQKLTRLADDYLKQAKDMRRVILSPNR
jgi:hypothetical protein